MTTKCVFSFFLAQGNFSFFQSFSPAGYDWLERLHGHVNMTPILAAGISAPRTAAEVPIFCGVCECVCSFMYTHSSINLGVWQRMWMWPWMALGAFIAAALMSQGGTEMKVEMVTTPGGCSRQTSKNSRDSSAFIANLPTPLLASVFFYKEAMCLLIMLPKALFDWNIQQLEQIFFLQVHPTSATYL